MGINILIIFCVKSKSYRRK